MTPLHVGARVRYVGTNVILVGKLGTIEAVTDAGEDDPKWEQFRYEVALDRGPVLDAPASSFQKVRS